MLKFLRKSTRKDSKEVKTVKYLNDIREVINESDPRGLKEVVIDENRDRLWFISSNKKVKSYALNSIIVEDHLYDDMFSWGASYQEYKEKYNEELIELINKEIKSFLVKNEDDERYSLLLIQYEPVMKNLKEITEDTYSQFGIINGELADKTLEILKEFLYSIEQVNNSENKSMDAKELDRLTLDDISSRRLEFELEFIRKNINVESIPEKYRRIKKAAK